MKTRSINKLFKSDVVFFDVFDTLIERTVGSPSEVFRLVGDEQFFDRRVSAERQCAEAGGQFSLTDIYRILEKYYGEETKSLMQKEIDAELSCCRAKEDVYSVFGRLVAAGTGRLQEPVLPQEHSVQAVQEQAGRTVRAVRR